MRSWLRLMLLVALYGCTATPTPDIGPADAMDRQGQVLEALDGAPLTTGNRLTLLRGGQETFTAMFQAIAEARDHVNLEFYILQDVRAAAFPGTSLFALLSAKLRQGVAVTLLYDSFGSNATTEEEWAALRRLGARTLAFNPLNPLAARTGWAPNNRDHRKILVVDGRIAFMGGVNLDRVYENPCHGPATDLRIVDDPTLACWRDTSIRIEGPAVAELQRLFVQDWARQGGEALPPRAWFPPLPPQGPARLRVLASAPDAGPPRYYITLLAAIRAARERIWLSTGFFVPTHELREALRDAARRGVAVQLVLPSASDVPAALAAGRAAYGDLLEAGVRIVELRGGVLHAKLSVVDGVWSAIGSSNLDRRSVALNDEVDAIVLGRDTAAQVEAVLRQDMAKAQEITLEAWRNRSLRERLRELSARVIIDLL